MHEFCICWNLILSGRERKSALGVLHSFVDNGLAVGVLDKSYDGTLFIDGEVIKRLHDLNDVLILSSFLHIFKSNISPEIHLSRILLNQSIIS